MWAGGGGKEAVHLRGRRKNIVQASHRVPELIVLRYFHIVYCMCELHVHNV